MGRKPNWTHDENKVLCSFVKDNREKTIQKGWTLLSEGEGQAPTNHPIFEVVLEAQAPEAQSGIMGQEVEAGFSQLTASSSNEDEVAESMFQGMAASSTNPL
ncbi:uncharacterized protein LOC584592 [Strongylocentrotus purpuratus]|uniref:Uncharacterized protein n=1 Tax=Strongylocentrotus purpuratus TaxID=7668 RepID=A0A7M7T4D4_STRPU|nr:uncharacterized protein LOC584592 [Strongylocentrotus purpuratus]